MSIPAATENPSPRDPVDDPPERLLPRISILSLIGLSTVCAAIFWAIRTGFQGNFIGLKSAVVIICLVVVCFIAYAVMFLVTYMCSLILRPLVEASGHSLERKRDALPTESLPAQSLPGESAGVEERRDA